MTSQEYLAWLCFKNVPGISGRQMVELLAEYPDPCEFVGQKSHPIYESKLLKTPSIEHLQNTVLPKNIAQIQKMMDYHKINTLSYHEYPARLKNIYAPPIILYYRGDLSAFEAKKHLAVVGTRKTSTYGREISAKIIAPICRQKVCIVSGLALGIDTIAHSTALREGTNTIAVLACGLENIYPTQNQELAKRICETGLLISEYEPGTKPDRWNFPARNRIISALSDLVFVVEGPISSGALLTAKNALQQGIDVCALPGNVNSINAEGPNHLIKNGASLIDCPEELSYLLGLEPEKEKQSEIAVALSEDEQMMYQLLKEGDSNRSFDEILIKTGYPVGKLSTLLTNLELKGLIAKESGNNFFVI
ncbi:MAG: DNA-processing protein DprA [Candidatus Cloacimonetes bacterium]|jgi:DNA processing protein|nr:DNA-processing protein DprA [Candidatus Cloacimonadota bacterium]NLO44144.1 DNA-protecting protein DprA [Candidatus Cloacimonadota bacterium]